MCGRLRLSSGVFVVPQVGTDSMLHAGVGAIQPTKLQQIASMLPLT